MTMHPNELFSMETQDEATDNIICYVNQVLDTTKRTIKFGEFLAIRVPIKEDMLQAINISSVKDFILKHYLEVGWDGAVFEWEDVGDEECAKLVLTYKNDRCEV